MIDNNNPKGHTEKEVISRRTLLNNSVLTGLGVIVGPYLANAFNLGNKARKVTLKKRDNRNPSMEDTYIDYFE